MLLKYSFCRNRYSAKRARFGNAYFARLPAIIQGSIALLKAFLSADMQKEDFKTEILFAENCGKALTFGHYSVALNNKKITHLMAPTPC